LITSTKTENNEAAYGKACGTVAMDYGSSKDYRAIRLLFLFIAVTVSHIHTSLGTDNRQTFMLDL
jgi:hypothetical protein